MPSPDDRIGPPRGILLAHGLMALFLASFLTLPRASTPMFVLVIVTGLVAARGAGLRAMPANLRALAPFLLPVIAYLLLVLIDVLWGDAPGRLTTLVVAGGLATLLALTGVPASQPDVRRWLLPGAAVGALGSAGLAIWQVAADHDVRPYGWLGVGPMGSGAVMFADLSAALGLLALALALTSAGDWRRGLGVAGFLASLLTLALTQTRGGVIGVGLAVLALAIALVLRLIRRRMARSAGEGVVVHRPVRLRARVAVFLSVALVAGSVLGVMNDRFGDVSPEWDRYQQGDAHSSVGQRLVLWNIALRAGGREPLRGTGFGRFGDEIDRQVAAGDVPKSVTVMYRQAHNEYLAAYASAGIPGLLAISLMLWVPILVLIGRIGAGGPLSPAAIAALLCTSAIAGFAMTENLFDRQITILFHFLVTLWLLAATGARDPWSVAAAGASTGSVGAASRMGSGASIVADPSRRARLSVSLITLNESRHLPLCLGSVGFADQWVVVDSGSKDGTPTIARDFGADVVETPDWPGFGVQKNRALARCAGDWVLSLDADEMVDDELRRAIEAVVAADDDRYAGYWIRRESRFCGQVLHHGLWGGDRVLRLFRRSAGRFSDDAVHERVLVDGPVGMLPGVLLHDSVESMEDALDKSIRYARAGALQLRARGRGGITSAWLHAFWTLVRGYLLRRGFLDGVNGWRVAWLSAKGTYWRYRWAARPQEMR